MRRAAAITRPGALRGAATPAMRAAGLWLLRLAGALALLCVLTTAARAHDGRHPAAAPAFAVEVVPGLSACAGRRGGPTFAVDAAAQLAGFGARAGQGRGASTLPAAACAAVPAPDRTGFAASAEYRRASPAAPALAVAGAQSGCGAPALAAAAAPDLAACAGRHTLALAADAPDPAGLAPCEGHCCGGGLCCPAVAAPADAAPAAVGRGARGPCPAPGLAAPAAPDGPRRPPRLRA